MIKLNPNLREIAREVTRPRRLVVAVLVVSVLWCLGSHVATPPRAPASPIIEKCADIASGPKRIRAPLRQQLFEACVRVLSDPQRTVGYR